MIFLKKLLPYVVTVSLNKGQRKQFLQFLKGFTLPKDNSHQDLLNLVKLFWQSQTYMVNVTQNAGQCQLFLHLKRPHPRTFTGKFR